MYPQNGGERENLVYDLAEGARSFRAAEARILHCAYGYALSYFDTKPLNLRDRGCLARLVLAAGTARQRRKESLESFVDAHAIAAEIVELFVYIRML